MIFSTVLLNIIILIFTELALWADSVIELLLQNTNFRRSWRPLVKYLISNIGLWYHNFQTKKLHALFFCDTHFQVLWRLLVKKCIPILACHHTIKKDHDVCVFLSVSELSTRHESGREIYAGEFDIPVRHLPSLQPISIKVKFCQTKLFLTRRGSRSCSWKLHHYAH